MRKFLLILILGLGCSAPVVGQSSGKATIDKSGNVILQQFTSPAKDLGIVFGNGISKDNIQTPSDQDVDVLQRAQMVAEIKALRATRDSLTEQNTLLKSQVADLQKAGTQYELRIADLKEAATHFTNATDIAPKIYQLYDERINDFKLENQRLRDENAQLRKSRNKANLIFGAVGVVLGHFLF